MRKTYSKMIAGMIAVIFGVAVWLALAPGAANAQTQAKIDMFFGNWAGGGVSETKTDSSRFMLGQRELDVDIKPAGAGGFEIIWSTLQKRKGPAGRAAEGGWKLTTLVFTPAGEGRWRAEGGDPLQDGQFSWAVIEENALVIRTFTVTEDGSAENQMYRRTVSGDSMELFYMRTVDGELKRNAMGRLARQKK